MIWTEDGVESKSNIYLSWLIVLVVLTHNFKAGWTLNLREVLVETTSLGLQCTHWLWFSLTLPRRLRHVDFKLNYWTVFLTRLKSRSNTEGNNGLWWRWGNTINCSNVNQWLTFVLLATMATTISSQPMEKNLIQPKGLANNFFVWVLQKQNTLAFTCLVPVSAPMSTDSYDKQGILLISIGSCWSQMVMSHLYIIAFPAF